MIENNFSPWQIPSATNKHINRDVCIPFWNSFYICLIFIQFTLHWVSALQSDVFNINDNGFHYVHQVNCILINLKIELINSRLARSSVQTFRRTITSCLPDVEIRGRTKVSRVWTQFSRTHLYLHIFHNLTPTSTLNNPWCFENLNRRMRHGGPRYTGTSTT